MLSYPNPKLPSIFLQGKERGHHSFYRGEVEKLWVITPAWKPAGSGAATRRGALQILFFGFGAKDTTGCPESFCRWRASATMAFKS
jgi:hypothetical protein